MTRPMLYTYTGDFKPDPVGERIEDIVSWAAWCTPKRRLVARAVISETCYVSTIFLGIDHRHDEPGEPLLFETRIFGGSHDGWERRYSTVADSRRGHEVAVELARKAEEND